MDRQAWKFNSSILRSHGKGPFQEFEMLQDAVVASVLIALSQGHSIDAAFLSGYTLRVVALEVAMHHQRNDQLHYDASVHDRARALLGFLRQFETPEPEPTTSG